MEISRRIFEVRKEVGLNQTEFGKRIGVTRSAVCNYENGNRSISEQGILSICREFHVNETWLRTGEGKMFSTAYDTQINALLDELNLNEMASRIVRKYFSLCEADRIMVKQFIQTMIAVPSEEEVAAATSTAVTPAIEPVGNSDKLPSTATTAELTAQVAVLKQQNQQLQQQHQADQQQIQQLQKQQEQIDARLAALEQEEAPLDWLFSTRESSAKTTT